MKKCAKKIAKNPQYVAKRTDGFGNKLSIEGKEAMRKKGQMMEYELKVAARERKKNTMRRK